MEFGQGHNVFVIVTSFFLIHTVLFFFAALNFNGVVIHSYYICTYFSFSHIKLLNLKSNSLLTISIK